MINNKSTIMSNHENTKVTFGIVFTLDSKYIFKTQIHTYIIIYKIKTELNL